MYTAERLQLEVDLRRAVSQSQLALHYQPQVAIGTGDITGREALLRWRHPTAGLLTPDRFISLAEESGQIAHIGEWVLNEACRQARAWELGGRPLRVAVNVSAIQFRQPKLATRVCAALERHELPAALLELEVTAGAVMGNVEQSIRTLKAIRATGIQIAIDDFGTGYSSLSYLKRLPISRLKIDRSFVADLGASSEGDSIAHAIVSLGRSMNLQVIAEGVETVEQLDCLKALGCDEYQGFLCSRARPAHEIEAFVRDWQREVNTPAQEATLSAKVG